MEIDISEVWRTFRLEMRRAIANRVRHHADPDDILQDVFIKVMQNQDKLTQAKDLRAYLLGITRNAVHDAFRKKKYLFSEHDNKTDFDFGDVDNFNVVEIADCCLRSFIDQLPEKYRLALIEVELNQVSQKQLAKELGISYSALKSRVQRGRQRLKEIILECCEVELDKYGNVLDPEQINCGCANASFTK